MMIEAKLCLSARANLGEGPLWDGILYGVDILHVFDPVANTDTAYAIGQPVGTVVPRESGG